ncbi:MAG: hypothetical protein HY071_07140 [Chloroflexi bacterium]|nr:hypothetical protein [Chloroflexota bacterium]
MPFPIVTTTTLGISDRSPQTIPFQIWANGMLAEALDGARGMRPKGIGLEVVIAPGPYYDRLFAALVRDRASGQQRRFSVEGVRADSVYEKPWGALAYFDASLTLVDQLIGGDARRTAMRVRVQSQPGIGYRILDAWDDAKRDWLAGQAQRVTRAVLETEAATTLGWHFIGESYTSTSWPLAVQGPVTNTPYAKARAGYLASLDRAAIYARSVRSLTARIERFDAFSYLGDGIVTVQVVALLRTTTALGTRETSFTRELRALRSVGGGWMIIDETFEPGVWASGNDLSLVSVDRTFG